MKRINKWIVVLSAMCVLSAYAPAPPREDLSAHEAKLKPLIEASREANEIDRDGRFIAYDNGIVRDTETGLEWIAGPDRDMTWDEAKSWVQSLNLAGGGWRMPTMDELEGLYKKVAVSRNMTMLLEKEWYVWSGETKDSSYAWGFSFYTGSRVWYERGSSMHKHAFAVRSRGDG